MLVLLTLSLASAEQSTAERELIQTAATCCMVAQPVLPVQAVVPLHQRRGILAMTPGHTRRGQTDYLGGTDLSAQLVALDGVPLLLDGQLRVDYQRTGTTTARAARPLPRPVAPSAW
jgi:hypothetical protein